MTAYNPFIFSGTLVRANNFRIRIIRAFSDAWFVQNYFLIELNSLISEVNFRLQQFLHSFDLI